MHIANIGEQFTRKFDFGPARTTENAVVSGTDEYHHTAEDLSYLHTTVAAADASHNPGFHNYEDRQDTPISGDDLARQKRRLALNHGGDYAPDGYTVDEAIRAHARGQGSTPVSGDLISRNKQQAKMERG